MPAPARFKRMQPASRGIQLLPPVTDPVLSNADDGTPTTDGATGPTVVTSLGTGTLYIAVTLASQSPDPTAAQIIAGAGGGIISSTNQPVPSLGPQ